MNGKSLLWRIDWPLATFAVTRTGAVLAAWLIGAPSLVNDLYAPFVASFLASPSIDPWRDWIATGGDPSAFPYGWPMLITLTLSLAIGSLIGQGWMGFVVISIAVDACVYGFLKAKTRKSESAAVVLFAYALSPLPIVCLVFLGSNDFLAMGLLVASFFALEKNHFRTAGVLIGLSVGVKLMLVVGLLIMALFVTRSQGMQSRLISFLLPSLATVVIAISPVFYSEGFGLSIKNAEDALGPLIWGIDSPSGSIQVLPLILLVAVYGIWLWKRMNSELLLLALSAPLILIANLPGAPLGWSLWAFPLLLFLAASLPRRYLMVASLATNAQTGVYLVGQVPALDRALDPQILSGLAATATLALAAGTAVLFWIGVVSKSDFLKLRDRPALILISGDSGAGKDTLADGLTRSLGADATVRVSGDDYHIWDRGVAQWSFVTHLNPQANELSRFFNDIVALVSGKQIEVGHYDHRVGRRISSKAAKSREFVVASGLHALWSRDLNKIASLRVFLEMSDDLRADLKVARDSGERGYSRESVMESLAQRATDSTRFIAPQALEADLVIRTEYDVTTGTGGSLAHKVVFRSEAKLFDDALLLELSNTCGLDVEMRLIEDRKQEVTVRGETTVELLQIAFTRLEPRVSEILGGINDWDKGLPGVIQMVTMVHLANNLRLERLIN